jgi:DNA processing protein
MKNAKSLYPKKKAIKINKEDRNYPKALLDLKTPPKQIYYCGDLGVDTLKKSIAIVGSRRMTRYGASVIDKFVSSFALVGVTTISGYMYGVDTAVHNKTVEYGGKTIAVIGGGISAPYPPENDKLYTKILKSGGVVLSEYEPEAKPKLWMYPQRNRIIAALATLGVLVIEAGDKSGSLITADWASKLNRRIFAVPGPISSSVSAGTNYLIKMGIAELVTSPDDIIGASKVEQNGDKQNHNLGKLEKEICDLLSNEEMSIDEISVHTNQDIVSVSNVMTALSLKGIVTEAQGKYYLV